MRMAQFALLGVTVALLGYLVVLALFPGATPPAPFQWFGAPRNSPTVAIVVITVGLLCTTSYLIRRNRASATVPVVIVVGLLGGSFVLGLASYWSCRRDADIFFFTLFEWTTSLVKGGVENQTISVNGADVPCPAGPPAALTVARLMVLGAFSVGVIGVAAAAFRLQADRIRAWLSKSVTAVVGVDEAGVSMVTAIARESARHGALVLLTAAPDGPVAQLCRAKGARVLQVDFDHPETMGSKRFWRKVYRLYLLSPDPSTNLRRLSTIGELLGDTAVGRRTPLSVRIDDPWLAIAWRAEQFGGSDTRWAGDAVGKYEVTARRLLDQITSVGTITQVLICGSSQLTLALCADMSRRRLERDYHPLEAESDLPKLVLVDEDAKRYLDDHEFHERARGFGTSAVAIDIVEDAASETVLRALVEGQEGRAAAIFVDSVTDPTTATRLAARFPALQVYAWDPQSTVAADSVPIAGKLRNYRLGIDLPDGQAHDNWERAAMLIHEKYVAATPEAKRNTPVTVPWANLSPFYRESNRRQVHNALRTVEQVGGHTWNTWGDAPDELTPEALDGLEPLDQLQRLGFAEDAIYAMAQAEFEDWSRDLRHEGWTYGPERDYVGKHHEKLVDTWADTFRDEALRRAALRSLATTLIQLRELGYRSKPKWLPYRRVGEVNARRRYRPWTWTTTSGDVMRASAGDWDVRDDADARWSVRNDVFRTSYRRMRGSRWAAAGVVFARAAQPGETIETLEGPSTTVEGDWVVMGDKGEQWSTPDAKFTNRYIGPVSFQERFEHWKTRNER